MPIYLKYCGMCNKTVYPKRHASFLRILVYLFLILLTMIFTVKVQQPVCCLSTLVVILFLISYWRHAPRICSECGNSNILDFIPAGTEEHLAYIQQLPPEERQRILADFKNCPACGAHIESYHVKCPECKFLFFKDTRPRGEKFVYGYFKNSFFLMLILNLVGFVTQIYELILVGIFVSLVFGFVALPFFYLELVPAAKKKPVGFFGKIFYFILFVVAIVAFFMMLRVMVGEIMTQAIFVFMLVGLPIFFMPFFYMLTSFLLAEYLYNPPVTPGELAGAAVKVRQTMSSGATPGGEDADAVEVVEKKVMNVWRSHLAVLIIAGIILVKAYSLFTDDRRIPLFVALFVTPLLIFRSLRALPGRLLLEQLGRRLERKQIVRPIYLFATISLPFIFILNFWFSQLSLVEKVGMKSILFAFRISLADLDRLMDLHFRIILLSQIVGLGLFLWFIKSTRRLSYVRRRHKFIDSIQKIMTVSIILMIPLSAAELYLVMEHPSFKMKLNNGYDYGHIRITTTAYEVNADMGLYIFIQDDFNITMDEGNISISGMDEDDRQVLEMRIEYRGEIDYDQAGDYRGMNLRDYFYVKEKGSIFDNEELDSFANWTADRFKGVTKNRLEPDRNIKLYVFILENYNSRKDVRFYIPFFPDESFDHGNQTDNGSYDLKKVFAALEYGGEMVDYQYVVL